MVGAEGAGGSGGLGLGYVHGPPSLWAMDNGCEDEDDGVETQLPKAIAKQEMIMTENRDFIDSLIDIELPWKVQTLFRLADRIWRRFSHLLHHVFANTATRAFPEADNVMEIGGEMPSRTESGLHLYGLRPNREHFFTSSEWSSMVCTCKMNPATQVIKGAIKMDS